MAQTRVSPADFSNILGGLIANDDVIIMHRVKLIGLDAKGSFMGEANLGPFIQQSPFYLEAKMSSVPKNVLSRYKRGTHLKKGCST